MADEAQEETLIALTTEIVAAHVSNNSVAVNDLRAIGGSVRLRVGECSPSVVATVAYRQPIARRCASYSAGDGMWISPCMGTFPLVIGSAGGGSGVPGHTTRPERASRTTL